jgi:threonine dehydratase
LELSEIVMSDDTSTGVATPVTPKMSGLAFTEYTAIATPPNEHSQRVPGVPPNWGIPEAFLLPNGYPDVSYSLSFVPYSLLAFAF